MWSSFWQSNFHLWLCVPVSSKSSGLSTDMVFSKIHLDCAFSLVNIDISKRPIFKLCCLSGFTFSVVSLLHYEEETSWFFHLCWALKIQLQPWVWADWPPVTGTGLYKSQMLSLCMEMQPGEQGQGRGAPFWSILCFKQLDQIDRIRKLSSLGDSSTYSVLFLLGWH